jgi:hypothetical protein
MSSHPTGSRTLCEAIQVVLIPRDRAWMPIDAVAAEIAHRGLYRRGDGEPADSKQIRREAHKHRHLFVLSHDGSNRIKRCDV